MKKSDPSSQFAVSLVSELGLSEEIIFRYKNHPSAKYRYGMIDGKVVRFPYSLLSAITFEKIPNKEFLPGLENGIFSR